MHRGRVNPPQQWWKVTAFLWQFHLTYPLMKISTDATLHVRDKCRGRVESHRAVVKSNSNFMKISLNTPTDEDCYWYHSTYVRQQTIAKQAISRVPDWKQKKLYIMFLKNQYIFKFFTIVLWLMKILLLLEKRWNILNTNKNVVPYICAGREHHHSLHSKCHH